MICLNCNNSLKKGAKKYCSLKCQQRYLWSIKKKFFEATGVWQGVKNETVICRNIKKYLTDIRGKCCEMCGITKWNGLDVPLVLDHRDGNSSNNELVNVRLVCGNCDMQLPTYKSRNRGKGRFYRRQRYKENKSY